MGPLPDMSGIFYLAIVGLIAIALAVIVGVPFIAWEIYQHVSIH